MSTTAAGRPGGRGTGASLGSRLAGVVLSVRWFLRGVLGADAYQRYLEHHARTHPGGVPLDERAFWRERMDWQDRNPQGRCC